MSPNVVLTKRLIELVKENTLLFDSNHPDNKVQHIRNSTWKSIATSMDVPHMDGKMMFSWQHGWGD